MTDGVAIAVICSSLALVSDHRAQLEAIRKDMDTLADDLAACRTPEAVCARIQRLRDHTETRSRDHGEGHE